MSQHPFDFSTWTDEQVLQEIEVAEYFWTLCTFSDKEILPSGYHQDVHATWAERLERAQEEARKRGMNV